MRGMAKGTKGKLLVIVESPAKARTIGRYLGKGYEVAASVGHVRDLPAKELGVEVRLPFLEPQFKALAMELDVGLKVRTERGVVWGKWVLRKAFGLM